MPLNQLDVRAQHRIDSPGLGGPSRSRKAVPLAILCRILQTTCFPVQSEAFETILSSDGECIALADVLAAVRGLRDLGGVVVHNALAGERVG